MWKLGNEELGNCCNNFIDRMIFPGPGSYDK